MPEHDGDATEPHVVAWAFGWRVSLISCLFLAVCGMPVRSIAQSPPAMEQIIVTARKREEPLFRVPVAVSAFDAQSIRDLGLVRLEDVARFTPGFSFDSAAGRQFSSYRPVVRGLTTIRNGVANTSAATTFIDGIYLGGSIQPAEFYNLERIEILRGPQAAMYGRGTYAGAINYVTRQPAGRLEGEVVATAAQHAAADLSAWASGPLNNRLGFFVGAGYREYGGEYRNVQDGTTVGAERQIDLTAKLRFVPWPSLSMTGKLGWLRTRDGHFAASLQARTRNNCCFRTPQAPRAREYYIGTAAEHSEVRLWTDLLDAAGGAGVSMDRLLGSLSLKWVTHTGVQLTSLTGYFADHVERGFDLSYAAYDPVPSIPGLFNKRDSLKQTDISEELRLASAPSARWQWSVGTYLYTGKLRKLADERVYQSGSILIIESSPGVLSQDEVDNFALFGSVEFDVAARWTLGAELRWARDDVTVSSRRNDAGQQPQGRFSGSWRSLTPRFTASWRANDDTMLYGNVARGTKPGDFNADVPDERFRKVDEESVWSYELGLKGRLRDRASYATAVYRLDVDDQQVTTLAELADGRTASLLTNAGKTRIYGLETELGLSITDALHLDLGYAWTDASYLDFVSVEQADLLGSDGSFEETQRLGSVAGNRLPRVSEHMFSARLAWQRELPRTGRLYSSIDWSFESSRFAQEHNLIETGDRQLTSLAAGIEWGVWDLTIWIRNLFDDRTPVDIQRYFDTRTGFLPAYPQLGDPPGRSPRGFVVSLPRGRQLGATLRLRF